MRALYIIAEDIIHSWPRMPHSAVVYVRTMLTLRTLEDHYMLDTGRSIVTRFLVNAEGWRGAKAQRIKHELKTGLKKY